MTVQITMGVAARVSTVSLTLIFKKLKFKLEKKSST